MSSLPIQIIILRGSYLFAIALFFVFWRKLQRRRVFGVLFWGCVLFVFVRSRWIEPQQVNVVEHMIPVGFAQDVVVIADLHAGVYKGSNYIQKVVNKISRLEEIDAVLIAGDFTYEPQEIDTVSLTQLFAPLGDLDMPVFAVLGNHDVQHPGPDLRKELIQALNDLGILFLHNDIYDMQGTTLVGLGPTMSGEDDVSLLEQVLQDNNVIVLAHNPDTLLKYQATTADITIAGHTHCGQIRVPFIQEFIRPYVYPIVSDVDCGWYDEKKLFITPGLGEVMLPLRLLNPPTIDVLRLR